MATKSRSTRSQSSRRRITSRAPAGFPTPDESQNRYDEADLNRAIEAYRFFYPTVSGAAIFRGNADVGIIDNKVFGVMDSKPRHVGFTYNSDTPYGPIQLDLSAGPFIIELPPGPLIVVSMDINQRWVADMGIPGPDAGKGGQHLLVPPDYRGDIPDGYHLWQSTSNRLLVGVRAMPVNGDVKGAMDRIKNIKVRPLNPGRDWSEPRWLNLTDTPQDTTPVRWENNIKYWQVLNDVIQTEAVFAEYRDFYGELAALGIVKGKPFNPDARMTRHSRAGCVDGDFADARAVLRRSSRGSRRLARSQMGVGRAAAGEWRLRCGIVRRSRRARSLVLSGHRRVAFDVPSQSGARLSVLARTPRWERRLPRRRTFVRTHRPAAGSRGAVLVCHGVRR